MLISVRKFQGIFAGKLHLLQEVHNELLKIRENISGDANCLNKSGKKNYTGGTHVILYFNKKLEANLEWRPL